MTIASSIGSVINGVSNTEVSWLSRGKVPALNSKRSRARSSSTSSAQNQPSKLSLGLQNVKEETDSLSSSTLSSTTSSPGTSTPINVSSPGTGLNSSQSSLDSSCPLDSSFSAGSGTTISSPRLARSRTISAPEFKQEREKLNKEQSAGFKKSWLSSFSRWRSGKESPLSSETNLTATPTQTIASSQASQASQAIPVTTTTTTTTSTIPCSTCEETLSPGVSVDAVVIPTAPIAASPAIASSIASSTSTVGSPKGFLMNTLRRFSKSQLSGYGPSSCPSRVLNKNTTRQSCSLSGLEGIPARRVSFDINTYHCDPPQQIPARKPKKGNVEVGPDGLLRKNGVVIQQSSPHPENYHHFNPFNTGVGQPKRPNTMVAKVSPSPQKEDSPKPSDKDASKLEEETTSKDSKSSESAAKSGDAKSKTSKITTADEEVPSMSNLIIDTPLKTSHEMYNEKDESEEDDPLDVDVEKLYTRCCHLREILPIPATLKQIKSQKAPLSLRLMNPRPTLIEIQSFADFIAVAPVSTLLLDNVTLTPDMFSLLLSAISASQWLEKLSLRNTRIDELSWKRLCYLIAMNTRVLRLDLSHQMKRDKDKELKPKTPPDVDWKLLCDALEYGQGMEELVLNGCLVPSEVFEQLMLRACKNTKRLGCAFNDLGPEEMVFVAQWMAGVCEGLDIGGNHLTYMGETETEGPEGETQISPVTALDVFVGALSPDLNLRFLSLNSTHLVASPTTEKLITALSEMRNLRFLDLSSNSELFPGLTTHLCKMLPLFPDLKRIHLDYCDLSPRDVVQISDALAKCKSMLHVSMVGNTRMDRTCVAALTVAVRVSKSIYLLDLEQSLVPKMEQRRIVHYCMRNMERLVYGKATTETDFDQDIEVGEDNRDIFDVGKDIASTVDDILEFNQETCQVSDMLLERAYHVKTRVQKVMDELFAKRNNGELTYEDKELLVRYCFLDATLNETLRNFEKQRQHPQHQGPTVHPLTQMMGLGNEPQIKAPDLEVEKVGDESRPPLSRNPSSASLQARRQEVEEGEFHKWGTFVMQVREHAPLLHAGRPSGDDLRKAILNATGVGTVSELIGEIIASGVDVEELLNIAGLDKYKKPSGETEDGKPIPMDIKAEHDAIDSFLEDLARVRSR